MVFGAGQTAETVADVAAQARGQQEPPTPGEPEPKPPEATGDAESEETVESLKSKLDEAQKQQKKLQSDLKALQTGRQRNEDRDRLLKETREDLASLRQEILGLAEHLHDGTIDQWRQSQAEHLSKTTEERQWERDFDEASRHLVEVLSDEGGNMLFTQEVLNGPEFTEVNQLWAKAREEKDSKAAFRAATMAGRVAVQLLRNGAPAQAAAQTNASSQTEAPKAGEQPPKRDRAAEMDLSVGGRGSGGGDEHQGKAGYDLIREGLSRRSA